MSNWGSARAAVFRNGVQVGATLSSPDGEYPMTWHTVVSVTSGWSAGDLLQIYALPTTYPAATNIKDVRLMSNRTTDGAWML